MQTMIQWIWCRAWAFALPTSIQEMLMLEVQGPYSEWQSTLAVFLKVWSLGHAESASPGTLLEMQTLRLHLRPTLEWAPNSSWVNKPSWGFSCPFKFENQWLISNMSKDVNNLTLYNLGRFLPEWMWFPLVILGHAFWFTWKFSSHLCLKSALAKAKLWVWR